MNSDEIGAFLREPRISILATLRPDGSPHLTPVWHHYDGERVLVAAEETAVKVRNIRTDPRVELCVSTDQPPYGFVQVNGLAGLSYDGIPALVRRMAVNYQGPEEGERYARKAVIGLDFIVITVTPSRTVGWWVG